jgi:carbonic anhydrase/acetyltransferase-like protein (isoleucine patch superfamily)
MERLQRLIERIIDRVNINLREPAFDVGPYVRHLIEPEQFGRFYAFYGLTPHHPLHFQFSNCSLAGSYFLGKCIADHAVLYKSDIRGDELKARGDVFQCQGLQIPLHDDEVIRIKDSYLIKTLVHSHCHDPESPEEFLIQNTLSMPFANIHGSPVEGSFIGPFSTVDLTSIHDCVIGAYSYVQVGELAHHLVPAGRIWIHAEAAFDFSYRFPEEVLERYIHLEVGRMPQGIFMDFVKERKRDFQQVFDVVQSSPPIEVPAGASLSQYAVVKGDTQIGENVLVAQRAYLEDAWLGKGSNAQEHCYIIHSHLAGNNVTAHGGKIIHARLGPNVFVGFNSFLQGSAVCPLTIGEASIVMPHTIIDLEEPLEIPARQLVWGYIRNLNDLKQHSFPLGAMAKVEREIKIGSMRFQGNGGSFVHAFQHRIEHILEANGAYFDGTDNRGHAQKGQNISFNTIQPYAEGELKGIYPTISIRP